MYVRCTRRVAGCILVECALHVRWMCVACTLYAWYMCIVGMLLRARCMCITSALYACCTRALCVLWACCIRVVCSLCALCVRVVCSLYARCICALCVYASTPVLFRVPPGHALRETGYIWRLIGVGCSSGGGKPGLSMMELGFLLFAPLVQRLGFKAGWTVWWWD